jgi:cell division septation protein DedD
VKERLTGAIILVVLIVLLVPELLSGPSKSAPAPQAAVTSAEEPPLRSYTINLADDSHTTGTSAGSANATPQASGPAQPTPIPDAASSQPEAPAGNSNPSEAEQAGTPAAAGSGAATVESTSVPPADDPPRAPQAAAPEEHPPPSDRSSAQERRPAATPKYAAATPKPAPEEHSGGGWMVQLGVFRIQANAEHLAQELKGQGFHTLVSEISGSGGPLWRVRAGPVAERAAAEQLSARLRAAGHAGSVVPK